MPNRGASGSVNPEYHHVDLPGGEQLTIRQSITWIAEGPNGAGDWLQLDCEQCSGQIGRFFVSDADWERLGHRLPANVLAQQLAAVDCHVVAHTAGIDGARG
jgi:hypothetical protein